MNDHEVVHVPVTLRDGMLSYPFSNELESEECRSCLFFLISDDPLSHLVFSVGSVVVMSIILFCSLFP